MLTSVRAIRAKTVLYALSHRLYIISELRLDSFQILALMHTDATVRPGTPTVHVHTHS
jgi:hypothetical protein